MTKTKHFAIARQISETTIATRDGLLCQTLRLDQIAFDLNGTSRDVTWDYTRNVASQIKSETQSNDSYSWDGHITVDRGYATNGLNQYTSAGSAAFCYDANGNLTADGSHVYKYDLENRLVERRVQTNTNCAALSYSGTLKASLKYDPTGRLYELSGGAAGTQKFVYDGNALILEYNASNVVQRRYVHGSNVDADDPLVWYEGSAGTGTGRRFVHADPRGSIVAVTNYLGNSIATNTYDEYGIPDNASGDDIATKGRFRYTGQAWIPELEMYYYKARIYSPTLGRFMQTDPIGYEDQFNLYAYVGNDPINGVDPKGEKVVFVGTPAQKERLEAAFREVGNSSKILRAIMVALEASPRTHAIGIKELRVYRGAHTTLSPEGFLGPDGQARSGSDSLNFIDTETFSDDVELRNTVAHEVFGHAFDADQGQLDRSINPETEQRRSEESAVGAENEYRAASDQELREEYNGKPVSGWRIGKGTITGCRATASRIDNGCQ